jgi:hypothetical protein
MRNGRSLEFIANRPVIDTSKQISRNLGYQVK